MAIRNKIILPALAALALLSSCDQAIDYDLPEGGRTVVIEGLVTDQPGPYTVRITETRGYLDQNKNPGLTGATVIITDNAGQADTLVASEPGTYRTQTLQGIPGRTYLLRVLLAGKEYSAQSTLRAMNPIDSLSYQFKPQYGFQEEGYYVSLHFHERAGKGDNYRFEIEVNGQRKNDITAINDDFYDGNYGNADLGYKHELNDSVTVHMLSLDKPGLDFWTGLQTLFYQTGGAFDTPPANPPTNLSNGAIGYFGASAKSTKSIVIR